MTKYTKKDLENDIQKMESENYRQFLKIQEQGETIKRLSESLDRLTKHLEKDETATEKDTQQSRKTEVFIISSFDAQKTKIRYIKAIRNATGLNLRVAKLCSEKPLPHLYVMSQPQADIFRRDLGEISRKEEFKWGDARIDI